MLYEVITFTDEPTINIRCDILEPTTMQGYERDPRSIARRAEAYLKSTKIADTAYFGPEPEFFILDDVRWGADMSGSFCKIDSEEASRITSYNVCYTKLLRCRPAG